MTAPIHELQQFPAPRPHGRPFDLPLEYQRILGEHRVPFVRLPVGKPAHLIGRYEDVRAVLTAPVSADGGQPGFPVARRGSASTSGALSFFRMDGADHRRYRKLTTRDFSVARVARVRPMLQRVVDELIDGIARQKAPVDLVAELALPVPSLMICQILGIPYNDRLYFQRLSDVLTRGAEHGREAFVSAISELRTYVEKLAEAKRDEPAEDLLTTLIEGFDSDPSLDPRQLAAIVLLLLVAGHETTASMISFGALALMNDPDQAEALKGDFTLAPNAVEELLRYISIAQWIPRVAVEDFVVGGHPIRVGEGIVVLPMVANRDPEVFPEPDRLDIRRDNADRHVAFGFGPHQCLGLQLARAELQIVYETLFRRLPGLRLAVPIDQLRFRQQAAMYGIEKLPVTW